MTSHESSAPLPETFGPVRLRVGGDGVATVTVDSPPVNAMGRALLQGLGDAADRLASDEGIRVVILTGAGTKAFMAGADIAEFEEITLRTDGMEKHSAWAGSILGAWAGLPQPVIAAVQASAVGGGLEVALTADFIFSEPTAKFGLPEVKLGLIPAGGGTQRLPLRIGRARALRMMLLGNVISAADAAAFGIVDEISEPGAVLDLAGTLAKRIAAMPRLAVQALKRLTAVPLADALLEERRTFLDVAQAADFHEGLTAFLQKRSPEFTHH